MSNVQSTAVTIDDLTILLPDGTKFNINGIFQEINIYESLLTPCITGNVLITDAVGFSKTLKFDGSEKLLLDISNPSTDITKIKRKSNRPFRIVKQTDITNDNQTSLSYILHFVSEQFILSEQQKIDVCYKGTYTEAAVTILNSNLKVPLNNIFFDKSLGLIDLVPPPKYSKPFDTLTWFAKRALDQKGQPTFLFFEDLYGYNFATMSSIMKSAPIFTANMAVKNISNDEKSKYMDYTGIRKLEVMTKFDFSKNLQFGLYSGTVVGINPLTRQFNITHPAPLAKIKSGGLDNNAKVVYSISTEQNNSSTWIQQESAQEIQTQDVPQKYAFARQAILQSFVNQRIKISLPGNFLVSPGRTLKVDVGPQSAQTKENKNKLDNSLSGIYAVLSSRHIIRPDMCESIVELVTGFDQQATSSSTSGVVSTPYSASDITSTFVPDYIPA